MNASGLVDRAVDVRLGGEVDDRVAALDRRRDGVAVVDVALDELDAVRRQALEVLAPPGVGELVEHAHRVVRVLGEPAAHEVRADEPGAAGDEQLHAAASTLALGEVGGQALLPVRAGGSRRARSLPSTE